MTAGWTIAKDALSFMGGVLISIPWFLDFGARLNLSKLKSIRSSMSSLQTVINRDEAWLAAPKLRDLLLTSIGLVAVCTSFFVALLQSTGVIGA
jgi:hypothetical protein